MKLLELAKKNLQEYISVRETLELLATTQQTPLSYVATFLISQDFDANISTYEVDRFFVIHSNDEWDGWKYEYTHSILCEVADDARYKEIFIFNENNISENLKNSYWKRSELYNLSLIKRLSIDFYFRTQDIKEFVSHNYINLDDFKSNEFFSDEDVKKLLKSGIPSYLPNSMTKCNLIDDFVSSSLNFFECNFDKGFEITRNELKQLFFDNQIIIKGFNDDLSKNNSSDNKNIWDENYLSILQSDVPLQIEKFTPLIEDGTIYDADDFIESWSINDDKEIKKYPLFFKNDTFTIQEATCLISNYDPNLVGNRSSQVVWLNENPAYVEAENFIYSAVRNGLFEGADIDFYVVESEKFKDFLTSKNIFIDGFNDKQSTTSNNENVVDNTKPKNTIANLDLDVTIDKNTVQQLNQEIEQLKNQLRNKDAEKAELEASQAVQQDCLLSQIFDESATERYSPDLVLSIKLWEHIYITNPKSDSHSNKADTWLKNNTGYDIAKKAGSASKIREVITPFILWSPHRDKKYKK